MGPALCRPRAPDSEKLSVAKCIQVTVLLPWADSFFDPETNVVGSMSADTYLGGFLRLIEDFKVAGKSLCPRGPWNLRTPGWDQGARRELIVPPRLVCARLTALFEWGARQQEPRVCTVRLMRCGSRRMGEALAGAPLDSAPKEYPPKIQQLVQDIASLTLLEISDLNELLKVSRAQSWVLFLVYLGSIANCPKCAPSV